MYQYYPRPAHKKYITTTTLTRLPCNQPYLKPPDLIQRRYSFWAELKRQARIGKSAAKRGEPAGLSWKCNSSHANSRCRCCTNLGARGPEQTTVRRRPSEQQREQRQRRATRRSCHPRQEKKELILTPDEALDRLLAKHDRKKARQAERAAKRSAPYDAPDIPRPPPMPLPDRQPEPASTIVRRGEKRKSEKQLQKRTKPSQPIVVERFDISQGDDLPPGADQAPPPVTIDMGTVTTLAKHMAANRRRPARAAEPSTAPTTEKESAQALTKKVKKAVKSSTRVRKDMVRKPRKVDRPTTEPNVTYV